MNYKIYHPIGGTINHKCLRGVYEYKRVATVEADCLADAFKQGQNDFNHKYAHLQIRSTCVGDVIYDGELYYYMVCPTGFVEVPPTVVQYIDWGNHMCEMEEEFLYNIDGNPANIAGFLFDQDCGDR